MGQKTHSARSFRLSRLGFHLAVRQSCVSGAAIALIASSLNATPIRSSAKTMEASPQDVAVHLTGFVPSSAHRTADGTIPMRWHESKAVFLDSNAKWLDLWHQHDLTDGKLSDGSADPGLRMHSDANPEAPEFVRTCAALCFLVCSSTLDNLRWTMGSGRAGSPASRPPITEAQSACQSKHANQSMWRGRSDKKHNQKLQLKQI